MFLQIYPTRNWKTLEKLCKNDNLVVQRVDRSNSVVLVDRDVYGSHMENILQDNTKFEKVDVKTRPLNNHEKLGQSWNFEEFKICR